MLDRLDWFAPILMCGGGFWLGLTLLGPRSPTLRAAAAGLCMLLGARYAAWRLTEGLPGGQGPFADACVAIFVGFEMLSLLSAQINLLMLARTRDRRGEADAYAGHPVCRAPVDVFIATYNESRDILERTLIGACAIDHPDLRVWLLDDGARDWVRALAEAHGAHYARRVKGKHAKAGNVNNGLARALATGRRPAFILLLDADFVANKTILRRALPLFHADDVGIVQTPQHFFNPDPIQVNVFSPTVWPDEQRYFFNVLMPSLDAWGTACCCGTSAVLRLAALEAVGGMATETVTEDMLTSFKMAERGWRTVYLDERLSLGLAPEGVGEYIIQRARWCLGGIQQMFTPWGFAGRARLPWIDRLNHFSSMLFWSISYPFRLMLLAAPAVWWWTGDAAFNATPEALGSAVLPYAAMSAAFNSVYAGNRVLPLLSDTYHLVASTAIVRSVASGLLRPFGQPFKVTPKGISSEGATVHWSLMAPFLLLGAATLGGMLAHLRLDSPLRDEPSYLVNVVWSLLDILVLAITCMACIDQPRRRQEERFPTGERGVLLVPGRRREVCELRDISVGGASIAWPSDGPEAPASGRLWLDDGRLEVGFALVRAGGGTMAVRFVATPAERAALILKLFDPRYGTPIDRVNPARALGVALRRLMA